MFCSDSRTTVPNEEEKHVLHHICGTERKCATTKGITTRSIVWEGEWEEGEGVRGERKGERGRGWEKWARGGVVVCVCHLPHGCCCDRG